MDLRVLRYFLAVAREGSITGAAKVLHVTQPTLSRQIKELEEDLGKKLFTRSSYNVRLTDEGMLLRQRAEDIVDMVDKTRAEFRSLDDITGGDIHIGAAESHGIEYIADAINNLKGAYPNIRYHFISGNYEEVTERLDRGLLDFCLLVKPIDAAKYNYITLPIVETWGVVMPAGSPLAEKRSIGVRDIIDRPLIFSRQAIGHELSKWFGDKMDKVHVIATYNLVYNPSILVKKGVGYLIAFDKLVNTSSGSGLVFRPLRPKLESGLCIAWKKYPMFSPAGQVFIEELRRISGTLEEQ